MFLLRAPGLDTALRSSVVGGVVVGGVRGPGEVGGGGGAHRRLRAPLGEPAVLLQVRYTRTLLRIRHQHLADQITR